MVVGVGEDAVDPTSDGAQTLGGALLDSDAAGKMAAAVEQRGGAVQRVQGVVQRGALGSGWAAQR